MQKYGYLKVLEVIKKDGRLYFRCLCRCGNKKVIYKNSVTLGYTKSCGCLFSSLASKRMKRKNPMWMPGIKEKSINTNKLLGTRPKVRGGNGAEMPVPQRVLLTALGAGWYAEHSVSTKLRDKYPPCYKIDIANPELLIGIEVDGGSHGSLKRKEQDAKKDKFLETRGWRIIRFKNKEIMSNLEEVLSKIL